MELSALLLLVAFRHRIEEPDPDSGLLRLAAILGQEVDPNAFHAVLAGALADGSIRDPIQLRPGALQCRWCLELTPLGVDQVLALLRKHGKTGDELLASTGIQDRL
jgi:hypothetical protein